MGSFTVFDILCQIKVEDSGEFVENVYHEENANALVGKLVGRHAIAHEDLKRNFTASDVVNEGYLFKRGSWVKSWYEKQDYLLFASYDYVFF